jgi:hypothetical protein
MFYGVLLSASATVAAAGDPVVYRTCSTSAKQVSSSGDSSPSSARSSGRVFGVFQTHSRSDARNSWYHTHPKWSAGRKATGAAYR